MGRKTGYRYRCSHGQCRGRVTLPRQLTEYVRPRHCHRCGRDQLKLDQYRHTVELSPRRVCACSGYPFPHRRGCQPWCVFSERLPTDDEQAARYGQPTDEA
ncbi:MAG: hypothetical protein CMJ75_19015 [Planctomycetaceae bacterium]|nr:hypothetical protein [Planctomycetaceae bacterium]